MIHGQQNVKLMKYVALLISWFLYSAHYLLFSNKHTLMDRIKKQMIVNYDGALTSNNIFVLLFILNPLLLAK
jgi:hypothetical protein